jgi:hypothetical protein
MAIIQPLFTTTGLAIRNLSVDNNIISFPTLAFVKKGAPWYDGFVDGFLTQHHQGGALTMKFKQSDG